MATLQEWAEIKRDFKIADFWITLDNETTEAYHPKHIGIKVTKTDKLVPKFLYYAITNALTPGLPITVRELQQIEMTLMEPRIPR